MHGAVASGATKLFAAAPRCSLRFVPRGLIFSVSADRSVRLPGTATEPLAGQRLTVLHRRSSPCAKARLRPWQYAAPLLRCSSHAFLPTTTSARHPRQRGIQHFIDLENLSAVALALRCPTARRELSAPADQTVHARTNKAMECNRDAFFTAHEAEFFSGGGFTLPGPNQPQDPLQSTHVIVSMCGAILAPEQ